jgi:DNA-binding transcriptional LysR family regulator
MIRDNLNDLVGFIAVAREGSFTKAAGKLGISQSALSHSISGLEQKLGIRLLARSTRSVSPTEAGERLLSTIGPRMDEIEQELSIIGELSGRPSGNIRITAGEHPAISVIRPKLSTVLHDYPEVNVEVTIENRLIDIVAERYDMGIRLGESVPKDMIAVRISPEIRLVVVAHPDYFKTHDVPTSPDDLKHHNCINLRLPTHGGLYAWEFVHNNEAFSVKVQGQLIFNSIQMILDAALAGLGVAYLPCSMVKKHVESGQLTLVLLEWCPPFPGYYLYYPNRKQPSSAFTTIVEALRYKAPST